VVGTFAAERAAKLRGQAAGLSTHQVLSEPITVRSGTYVARAELPSIFRLLPEPFGAII